MITVKLIPAVLALGILVSLSACCPITGSPAPAPQIEDVAWKLVSYGNPANPQNIIAGTEVTVLLQSADGSIQGNGGCNGYGGSYEINGVRLTVSELISTKIYCTQPPGVSEQETSYLEILQEAESFQVSANELRINSSGNQVLIFTR